MTKEQLHVMFRTSKRGEFKGDVTAVFPTLWEYRGLTCYAHTGQHGICTRDWISTTRPSTPDEYKDLLAELRRIYEHGKDAVTLKVVKRAPSWNSAAMRKARDDYYRVGKAKP